MRYLLLLFLLAIRAHSVFAQFSTGCVLEKSILTACLRTPERSMVPYLAVIPPSASLKVYCPEPMSQGVQGSCTAFATAYYARTILYAAKNNWMHTPNITRYAFSPSYIYNQIVTGGCDNGSSITNALFKLKHEGCLLLSQFPYSDQVCHQLPDQTQKNAAQNYTIQDYRTLINSDGKIDHQSIKQALSEGNPVVISIKAYLSFKNSKEDVWNGLLDSWKINDYHAITIIGYDDSQYGGSFQMVNSWGMDWGNQGYSWIKYKDFANIVQCAFELIENPKAGEIADLSANIRFGLKTSFHSDILVTHIQNGVYQTNEPYISGTYYRIYLENKETAYLYVFASDLTGQVVGLFPPENVSPLVPYKNNKVILPGEQYYLKMDNTIGTDFICVLYSKSPLDITTIEAEVKSGTGDFRHKVEKAIGQHRMIPSTQISYKDNSIGFHAKSMDKDVVVVIVEMEHR